MKSYKEIMQTAVYQPKKDDNVPDESRKRLPKDKPFNEGSVDFVKNEVMENVYYWSDITTTNTEHRTITLPGFPKRKRDKDVAPPTNKKPEDVGVKDYKWVTENSHDNIIDDPKLKLVARTSVNNEQKTVQHYVLVDGGELYSPNEISSRYNKRNWKLVLVKNEAAMNLYLAYLGFGSPDSKNSVACKKKAERLL